MASEDNYPSLRADVRAAAAYIHVPFCAHRCGYCDFTLIAGRDDLIESYLNALEIELSTLTDSRPQQTLFLGGGTPSHLSIEQLHRLFDLLERWLPLEADAEFSLEANPLDMTIDRLKLFSDRGVNRLSLGIQSFDDRVLKVLERDHDAMQARRAIESTLSLFENVSLDLIFGVPGQSIDSWHETLTTAIKLAPTHLSTYGLTFEKGTSFWTRRERGTLLPINAEIERDMYGLAMDLLPCAVFEQYELSNFARPGFLCQHNIGYWSGRPFYGFGPGAAQYLDGCRELNHRSVTTWLLRVQSGRSPIMERERLNAEDRARELAVLNLRRRRGISREEFLRQTDFSIDELAGDAIRKFSACGWLENNGSHIKLTREGCFFADTIVAEFL